MKKYKLNILFICIMLISSCGKKTQLNKIDKKEEVIKKESKVVSNLTDKKEGTEETEKKEVKKQDITGSIVSYEKHDDHWHIKLSNGNTIISYKDPTTIYPKEAFLSSGESVNIIAVANPNRVLTSWYKHGNHWHLLYSDGSQEISYTSPFETKEIVNTISVDEVARLENNKAVNTNSENSFSNSLFEKVIDHGNHIHVWVNGNEYSISRELYNQFISKNKFDEVLASGLQGLYYSDIKDENLKRDVEYISKAYGVRLDVIRVSESYFSFNDPGHEYDPTHIHPYFVPRELFYIPTLTGIPEIDFENELISLAYRSGIPASSIKVKNGKFVLPHGDHDHYVNIQSTGYEEYIKNKKPDITGPYIKGELNEVEVLNEVENLRNLVSAKYSSQVELRRVMRVLEEFEHKFNTLKTNSTEGYLSILNNFKELYIHDKKDTDTTLVNSKTNEVYQKLIDDISSKNSKFFEAINVDKEKFISDINENSTDKAKLYENTYKMKEYDRFNGRIAIVGMGYVKYFYNNFENKKVLPNIVDQISGLLIRVSDKHFFGMKTDVEEMVDLNIQLNKSLNLEKEYNFDLSKLENYNKLNNLGYREKIESFLESVDSLIFPIENPDAEKLPKDLVVSEDEVLNENSVNKGSEDLNNSSEETSLNLDTENSIDNSSVELNESENKEENLIESSDVESSEITNVEENSINVEEVKEEVINSDTVDNLNNEISQ